MVKAYPDPDSVVFATTQPPRYVGRLTYRAQGPQFPLHSHDAYMDGYGNGNTRAVLGHWHEIRNGQVMPARDGHTHLLTNLPCGAG